MFWWSMEVCHLLVFQKRDEWVVSLFVCFCHNIIELAFMKIKGITPILLSSQRVTTVHHTIFNHVQVTFSQLVVMVVTRPLAKSLYLKLTWICINLVLKNFCLLCVFIWLFYNWINLSCRILTWGDGYVDKVIEDRQAGDLSAGPIVSKNQIVSSSCYHKCYPFCSIEAALLSMSNHLYPLGEG